MKNLNLNAIRIDGGTQSRVGLHESTVADYAALVSEGCQLPPIMVFADGSDTWLADGFHRYHAYRMAGKASIPAEVRQGTRRDAILFSAGANGAHGLPRTNADKRRAVEMVLADQDCADNWSDTEVAKHCAVSVPFVSAIRRPDVMLKQQAARAKTTAGPVDIRNPITPTGNSRVLPEPQSSAASRAPSAPADDGPDAAELAAAQRAQDEEVAALMKLAAADDKLAAAIADAKQLRALNRVLQERNDGLMNEKNELVKRIKSLQRKIDKLEKSEQPA